jgi:hypothetical protein
MMIEFSKLGLNAVQQTRIDVYYEGELVEDLRAVTAQGFGGGARVGGEVAESRRQ